MVLTALTSLWLAAAAAADDDHQSTVASTDVNQTYVTTDSVIAPTSKSSLMMDQYHSR